MTRKSILENVQVGVHGELKAKVINRDGEETKKFAELHAEMNSHFNNDQISTIVPYHPQSGQMCVGKVGSVWHRVKVDGQMGLKSGLHASCLLIDEGTKCQVPVPSLRQIPGRFAEFPQQIKSLSLYGIKPLSLQISSEDLMVYERSVAKWDSSAVKFMSDHIKAAVYIKVKIVSRSADGVYPVKMYLYTRSGNRVCLNEALIDQRYAMAADHEDVPTLAVQKDRKSPEMFSSLRMSRIHKEPDTARSDVEQPVHNPTLLERGCMTDTEAVSAMSHRNLPRLVSPSKRHLTSNHDGQNMLVERDCVTDTEAVSAMSHRNLSKPLSPSKRHLDYAPDCNKMEEEYDERRDRSNTTHVYDSLSSKTTSETFLSSQSRIQCSPYTSNCDSVNTNSSHKPYTDIVSHQSDLVSAFQRQPNRKSAERENTFLSPNIARYAASNSTSPLSHITGTSNITPVTKNDALNSTSPMAGKIGSLDNTSPLAKTGTFNKSPLAKLSSLNNSPLQAIGRGSSMFGRGALLNIIPPNKTSPTSPGLQFQEMNQNNNRTIQRETLSHDSFSNVSANKTMEEIPQSTGIDRQSDASLTFKKHTSVSSALRDELSKSFTKEEGRNQLRNYESGNESSASGMSAMAASVTGLMQQTFTKSRRPGQTAGHSSDARESNLISGHESSDSHLHRTHLDAVTREKSPRTNPVKCSSNCRTSSSDSDSVMRLRQDAETSVKEPVFVGPKASKSKVEPLVPVSTFSIDGNHGASIDKKTEMLGKFSGEKLLKELSSGMNPTTQAVIGTSNTTDKPKSEILGVVDNVLMHGRALKKPVYNIEGFPFIHDVTKHWEQHKFVSPKLVQSYGWPAVMSGRHIIAIAPPGSGKTMTYLYALITYLAGSKMYRELPAGMGPLVIILCKSWRRAEGVCHSTSQVVDGRKTKVLLVYGGGLEDNRAFELINGCDILITTPPSLKRLLEKGYTDLRRLCHLVIDDCEQTLDTFHVEINYIKTEYNLIIQNEVKQLECPRQILVFGSQWNDLNGQFTENVLNEPIVIVTSPFEAAIYGRVRQIPHFCKKDGRMSEVLGLLENIACTEHKIIIFSSNMEDIRFLNGGLRAYSHDVIVVSEHMELYDVKVLADEWAHGRSKLLVCSDTHVMNMNIMNATIVIHYDLPNSKTKFGNRMSCMRQHFYNFATAHKKKMFEPVSHLLITENCGQQVRTIQELLKRSKGEIPKQLKAFLAGMVEKREQDENKELCYQLLAYGTCSRLLQKRHMPSALGKGLKQCQQYFSCITGQQVTCSYFQGDQPVPQIQASIAKDKWRCGCRHVVIPELDTSPETEWLPNEGQVKVLVTHVNDSDASHFYVRLLSITAEDGTESEPALTYMTLMMELELYYKKLENQKRNTAPFTGDLCGYQDRGVFYRVLILDIPNMNNQGKGTGSIEVSVKFVDIGKDMDIDVNKLYELPMQFKTVPFQALEVFVCRIKPVDKDPEWTIRASVFINELLYGKEFEGKIVLRLGGILWLDPLVERVYLGETRAIINRSYIHVELVRNGFANENPTHLEKLYKLCQGKVELPRLLLVKTKMSQILQTDSLPLCRQYHDVHVSSVTSPDLFFVQRREKLSELEELMEDIAQYVHQLEDDDGIKDIQAGQYCLAQYESFDKRWYRARVMNVLEEAYEIIFADYGDLDTVPREKVKEFPIDKFFELPLQAIECKLAGICTDKIHEKKSGDALWDLTHFVNGDLKSLVTTVKSQMAAEFTGRHRFVVEMFDTSGSKDLNMAQELVYRCLAFQTEESDFEDLFPKPAGLRRKIYSLPLDKVPDMAALLYWELDNTKAFEISRQLLDLIKSSVIRSTETLHPSMVSALQSLTKLIGRVQWPSIEAAIEECILELLNTGEDLCEEFLQSGCLSNVTRCLEMENNSPMQCQAAEFVSSLCTVSTKIRSFIQSQRNNVLFTLNELFEYTPHEEIKGSVCKAFTSLVSGSDSVFQVLMEKAVCTKLKTLLSESDNHDVQEAVILLLSALSDHDGSHSDLKRESLIEAIVKNLKSTICDKCIQHSVEFCAHYASTRRKHKTHLLEVEMVPVLNRLIKLDIQSTTKQQCKDLVSSLVVKFPSEPMTGVHYVEERNVTSTELEIPPEVHWCQTTFVIQLSLKIKECTCTRDSFIFTEQSVQFRDKVNGVQYAFHLDLFDKITPVNCKVAVKAQEILVSLCKSVKGRWTRLQRGKQRPQWIFVDYERFVDSQSDSDTYDENRPFVFKKKKKTKKLQADRSTASAYRVLSSNSDSEDSLYQGDDREERDEFDIFS